MISISTKIQIILFPYKSTMIKNGIYKTFLGKKTKLKQQLCQILKVCISLPNVCTFVGKKFFLQVLLQSTNIQKVVLKMIVTIMWK